jgi:hypothetical protein
MKFWYPLFFLIAVFASDFELDLDFSEDSSSQEIEKSRLNQSFLPTNIRPTHYDLIILPDLDGKIFFGKVKIE